eukprot:TRINITY_DN5502_c1_g1_i1.p1 TRINITY_DN5502_c1_g1~~TRINITY_DN5502_c1_g1_i1.p1  ORF type:complete len:157 (-),score=44.17 TRINITY_DN5502_c1_g1_i1:1-471(-)
MVKVTVCYDTTDNVNNNSNNQSAANTSSSNLTSNSQFQTNVNNTSLTNIQPTSPLSEPQNATRKRVTLMSHRALGEDLKDKNIEKREYDLNPSLSLSDHLSKLCSLLKTTESSSNYAIEISKGSYLIDINNNIQDSTSNINSNISNNNNNPESNIT